MKKLKATFKCPVCNKAYVYWGWLARHLSRFNSPDHNYKVYNGVIKRQTSIIENIKNIDLNLIT